MPEGDTIFRAARTLHRALSGRRITRFESMFPKLTRVHEDSPVTGRTVEAVAARGKHLLMTFSGGLTLRTHMRMNGSWHIYRPGERWQRPRRDMRIVLETSDYIAVGFTIPEAEWLRTGGVERHDQLRRLGPDLLAGDFDAAEAARRLRARASAAVADAILNQRVVAGIGNVYKSEVLFACRIDPFRRVESLTDGEVACVLETARRFLLANVDRPRAFGAPARRAPRRTGLWVYGRAGDPCLRCGTPVTMTKQGLDARLTYWCPACQR